MSSLGRAHIAERGGVPACTSASTRPRCGRARAPAPGRPSARATCPGWRRVRTRRPRRGRRTAPQPGCPRSEEHDRAECRDHHERDRHEGVGPGIAAEAAAHPDGAIDGPVAPGEAQELLRAVDQVARPSPKKPRARGTNADALKFTTVAASVIGASGRGVRWSRVGAASSSALGGLFRLLRAAHAGGVRPRCERPRASAVRPVDLGCVHCGGRTDAPALPSSAYEQEPPWIRRQRLRRRPTCGNPGNDEPLSHADGRAPTA
jgi:hypothetical protein